MMTLKQALGIHTGDTVYDFSGRTLKVGNYSITFAKGEPVNAYFTCTDINKPEDKQWSFTYQYKELYQNWDDLSDEYKSFITWARKTYHDLQYKFMDDIQEIQQAYITGFIDGFKHKQKMTAEEYLQK